MALGASPTTILNQVAESLVIRQKYPSLEDALLELALSAVRSKITFYRRRIRKMERKYAADFDAFTTRLRGKASPAEEDDWLAWRSARNMLADWQQAYRELLNFTNCSTNHV